ncbi:hypothetical protein ACQKWADRAFT_330622 [Trichoderma austrokoningii]
MPGSYSADSPQQQQQPYQPPPQQQQQQQQQPPYQPYSPQQFPSQPYHHQQQYEQHQQYQQKYQESFPQPTSLPMPQQATPPHDALQPRSRASSGSLSSSNSSSSSYLEISRQYPTGRYGGFFSAFMKAPSERRRRRRRGSGTKKRRGVFFGGGSNSSHSSINSDLAYGTGFVKKDKDKSTRYSSSPQQQYSGAAKRDKTDEEILAIGRQLSDLARHRPSGLASAAAAITALRKSRREAKKRGLSNSKKHRDSSSDESDWDSSSDESALHLAYGGNESSRSNVALAGAAAAVAGAVAASSAAESYPTTHRRKSSVVDPRLFGPVNSLRGLPAPSSAGSGRHGLNRYDNDRPPTGESQADSAHRPTSIPLEQPIPMVPVSNKVFEAGTTRDSRNSYRRQRSNEESLDPTLGGGVAAAAAAAAARMADRRGPWTEDRVYRDDRDQAPFEELERRRANPDVYENRRNDDVDSPRSEATRQLPDYFNKDAPGASKEKRKETLRYQTTHDVHVERREAELRESQRQREREQQQTTRTTKAGDGDIERPTQPASNSDIDPFKYQVADDAFSTPQFNTPRRPLTPQVVTVERVPNFAESSQPPSSSRRQQQIRSDIRLSRKDNYDIEMAEEERRRGTDSGSRRRDPRDGHEYEEEEREARSILDEAKRSTIPVAAVAVASAIAVEEERSRERRRRDLSDDGSRDRSQPLKDVVQEEADKYYRESVIARKIASDEMRSQSKSPDGSVVDKWDTPSVEEPITIVTPPNMEGKEHEDGDPYGAPNADVKIDYEIYPHETGRFRATRGVDVPRFISKDPSCERERPLLNIVRPTPVPSPDPTAAAPREPQSQQQPTETPSSRDIHEEESLADSSEDEEAEPKGEATQSSPTGKSVSWGQNEVNRFVVESPEARSRAESPNGLAETEEKPRPRLSKSSRWGKIAAVIAAGTAEHISELDRNPEAGSRDLPADDNAPSAPGSKIPDPEPEQMPGSFDDEEFTATVAAGLEKTGFNPNIVIDDPAFRRRNSRPETNETPIPASDTQEDEQSPRGEIEVEGELSLTDTEDEQDEKIQKRKKLNVLENYLQRRQSGEIKPPSQLQEESRDLGPTTPETKIEPAQPPIRKLEPEALRELEENASDFEPPIQSRKKKKKRRDRFDDENSRLSLPGDEATEISRISVPGDEATVFSVEDWEDWDSSPGASTRRSLLAGSEMSTSSRRGPRLRRPRSSTFDLSETNGSEHPGVSSVVSEPHDDERKPRSRESKSLRHNDNSEKHVSSRKPRKVSGNKKPGLFSGIFNNKPGGNRTDEKRDSFFEQADTLGAGVGPASLAAAAAAATALNRSNAADVSSEPENISRELSGSNQEFNDYYPVIAPRAIAIDPQYRDLLPLPPSEPGSPVESDFGDRDRRFDKSHRRQRSNQDLAASARNRSHSNTAVPLTALRRGIGSGPPSPVANKPPRTPPRPTSWDSTKEFMPLMLLEHSRRGSLDKSVKSEELPPLPPSEVTSEAEGEDVEDFRSPMPYPDDEFRLRLQTEGLPAEKAIPSGESEGSTPKADLTYELPARRPTDNHDRRFTDDYETAPVNSTSSSAQSARTVDAQAIPSPTTPTRRRSPQQDAYRRPDELTSADASDDFETARTSPADMHNEQHLYDEPEPELPPIEPSMLGAIPEFSRPAKFFEDKVPDHHSALATMDRVIETLPSNESVPEDRQGSRDYPDLQSETAAAFVEYIPSTEDFTEEKALAPEVIPKPVTIEDDLEPETYAPEPEVESDAEEMPVFEPLEEEVKAPPYTEPVDIIPVSDELLSDPIAESTQRSQPEEVEEIIVGTMPKAAPRSVPEGPVQEYPKKPDASAVIEDSDESEEEEESDEEEDEYSDEEEDSEDSDEDEDEEEHGHVEVVKRFDEDGNVIRGMTASIETLGAASVSSGSKKNKKKKNKKKKKKKRKRKKKSKTAAATPAQPATESTEPAPTDTRNLPIELEKSEAESAIEPLIQPTRADTMEVTEETALDVAKDLVAPEPATEAPEQITREIAEESTIASTEPDTTTVAETEERRDIPSDAIDNAGEEPIPHSDHRGERESSPVEDRATVVEELVETLLPSREEASALAEVESQLTSEEPAGESAGQEHFDAPVEDRDALVADVVLPTEEETPFKPAVAEELVTPEAEDSHTPHADELASVPQDESPAGDREWAGDEVKEQESEEMMTDQEIEQEVPMPFQELPTIMEEPDFEEADATDGENFEQTEQDALVYSDQLSPILEETMEDLLQESAPAEMSEPVSLGEDVESKPGPEIDQTEHRPDTLDATTAVEDVVSAEPNTDETLSRSIDEVAQSVGDKDTDQTPQLPSFASDISEPLFSQGDAPTEYPTQQSPDSYVPTQMDESFVIPEESARLPTDEQGESIEVVAAPAVLDPVNEVETEADATDAKVITEQESVQTVLDPAHEVKTEADVTDIVPSVEEAKEIDEQESVQTVLDPVHAVETEAEENKERSADATDVPSVEEAKEINEQESTEIPDLALETDHQIPADTVPETREPASADESHKVEEQAPALDNSAPDTELAETAPEESPQPSDPGLELDVAPQDKNEPDTTLPEGHEAKDADSTPLEESESTSPQELDEKLNPESQLYQEANNDGLKLPADNTDLETEDTGDQSREVDVNVAKPDIPLETGPAEESRSVHQEELTPEVEDNNRGNVDGQTDEKANNSEQSVEAVDSTNTLDASVETSFPQESNMTSELEAEIEVSPVTLPNVDDKMEPERLAQDGAIAPESTVPETAIEEVEPASEAKDASAETGELQAGDSLEPQEDKPQVDEETAEPANDGQEKSVAEDLSQIETPAEAVRDDTVDTTLTEPGLAADASYIPLLNKEEEQPGKILSHPLDIFESDIPDAPNPINVAVEDAEAAGKHLTEEKEKPSKEQILSHPLDIFESDIHNTPHPIDLAVDDAEAADKGLSEEKSLKERAVTEEKSPAETSENRDGSESKELQETIPQVDEATSQPTEDQPSTGRIKLPEFTFPAKPAEGASRKPTEDSVDPLDPVPHRPSSSYRHEVPPRKSTFLLAPPEPDYGETSASEYGDSDDDSDSDNDTSTIISDTASLRSGVRRSRYPRHSESTSSLTGFEVTAVPYSEQHAHRAIRSKKKKGKKKKQKHKHKRKKSTAGSEPSSSLNSLDEPKVQGDGANDNPPPPHPEREAPPPPPQREAPLPPVDASVLEPTTAEPEALEKVESEPRELVGSDPAENKTVESARPSISQQDEDAKNGVPSLTPILEEAVAEEPESENRNVPSEDASENTWEMFTNKWEKHGSATQSQEELPEGQVIEDAPLVDEPSNISTPQRRNSQTEQQLVPGSVDNVAEPSSEEHGDKQHPSIPSPRSSMERGVRPSSASSQGSERSNRPWFTGISGSVSLMAERFGGAKHKPTRDRDKDPIPPDKDPIASGKEDPKDQSFLGNPAPRQSGDERSWQINQVQTIDDFLESGSGPTTPNKRKKRQSQPIRPSTPKRSESIAEVMSPEFIVGKRLRRRDGFRGERVGSADIEEATELLESLGPFELLRRSSQVGDPIGGLLREANASEISVLPPMELSEFSDYETSDYRLSPPRTLPSVEELPEPEAEAEATASEVGFYRDSGFSGSLPSRSRRHSTSTLPIGEDEEKMRDSGVDADWIEAAIAKLKTPEPVNKALDRPLKRRLRRSTLGGQRLGETSLRDAAQDPEKKTIPGTRERVLTGTGTRPETPTGRSSPTRKGYGAIAGMGIAPRRLSTISPIPSLSDRSDTPPMLRRAAASFSFSPVTGPSPPVAGPLRSLRRAVSAQIAPGLQRPESPALKATSTESQPRSVSDSQIPSATRHQPDPSRADPSNGGPAPPSPPNSGAMRLRTPERRKISHQADAPTPPLRRADKRGGGDLRSLRQQNTSSPTLAPSEAPVANEGRVRAKDKTDVFDGLGEGQFGSPRSPTRPHSMRRRQSMQVLELEARVEQLIAENRLLSDARHSSEQHLSHRVVTALSDRDTQIEALNQRLKFLKGEVSRLTEVNEGLTSANAELANKDNSRYADLQVYADRDGNEAALMQALHEKDAQIADLTTKLDAAKERIRELQRQILESKAADVQFLSIKDEDYFDHRCQQLCSHVQQWVLRFSKFSDMRACRLTNEINDEKIIDRLDNAVLDGSDVDRYLNDRVRRRDIFMSMTMNMIWEFVFTRYLFGMDREQRQKLKSLEKLLTEVGPPQAVRQWRAVTLTLLSKRDSFKRQRDLDTEAVVQAIYQTLCKVLPPPSNLEGQIQAQLRRVMHEAVHLSIEMRTQKAEYMMLPPLQPEYDADGELVQTVQFNASMMSERSGTLKLTNEELEARGAIVRVVLFPLVVKKGDDDGSNDEEIVICPAQVLIARSKLTRQPTPSDGGRVSTGTGRLSGGTNSPDTRQANAT